MSRPSRSSWFFWVRRIVRVKCPALLLAAMLEQWSLEGDAGGDERIRAEIRTMGRGA